MARAHGRFHKRITLPLPPPDPEPDPNTLTADKIVYAKGFGDPLRTDGKFPDWGAHELNPGITATYDWRYGARPGVTGPPWPATWNGDGGWDHHNVWYEAIPAEGGMPAASRTCRFQISVPKVHHYDPTTGLWTAKKVDADFTRMDGGYWAGAGTYQKIIDWPTTTPNPYWRKETVGWSIDLNPTVNNDGTPKVSQCIAHGFFPSAFSTRLLIDGDDHFAVLAWVRLISDDTSINLNQARYVGRMSADAFLASTGSNTVAGGRVVNPAMGHSRLLRLTPEWKLTGWITGDESKVRQIVANHPLLGSSPPPA